MFRKIWGWSFLLVFLVYFLAVMPFIRPAKAEKSINFRIEKSVQKVQNSVFVVKDLKENPIGHAWKVTDNIFLTDNHVVDGGGNYFILAESRGNAGYSFPVVVVKTDLEKDMAVLENGGISDFPNLHLAGKMPPKGSPIFFLDKMNGKFLRIGTIEGVKEIETNPPIFGPVLLETNFPVPGESGTPVFNADGEVVGMMNAQRLNSDNSPLDGVARPVSMIKEFLKGGWGYEKRESGRNQKFFLDFN